jgi:hypothetical protein
MIPTTSVSFFVPGELKTELTAIKRKGREGKVNGAASESFYSRSGI